MWCLALRISRDQIEKDTFKDENVKKVILLCLRIWCLSQLNKDSHALYETGYFSTGANDFIKKGLNQLLTELRPHMIPIVESTFDNLHFSYLSCIGNKYGDIYESQLEWARQSRLNKKPIPDYFHTIIKPIFKGAKL